MAQISRVQIQDFAELSGAIATDDTPLPTRTMLSDQSLQLGTPAVGNGVVKAVIEPSVFEMAAVGTSTNNSRNTIGRRVRKSVAIVVGLFILVATIGGYAVSTATRQTNNFESQYHELIDINSQVLVSAVASDLAIRSFLLSGNRTYISALNEARPQLVESVAQLDRVATEVGDQGLLQLAGKSSSIVSIWLTTFVDRTMIVAPADTPRADQLVGAELINNLRSASISIDTYIDELNDKAVAEAGRVRRRTIEFAAVVLLVAFLVIAVLLIMSASDISFPLINLSRVVNRIYRGDRTARADENVGPAEIRTVARAVNALANQQERAHSWEKHFNLAKSDFLNIVNRELLKPLTIIAGSSELLGDENILSNADRSRMAATINRNAFRLNDLIDNMLAMLRIDLAAVQFELIDFDIRSVINESVESFQMLANSLRLTIVSDLGDVALTVHADENEILRVIDNLISNAVKFSKPGGRIDLSARQIISAAGKREVVLSVKDTGIGIAEGELSHVGSRFYRSSSALAADIPGEGIGLMVVDFIVREHGGTWSLNSSESDGTTVEVRLPLAVDSTSGNSD